MSEMPKAEHREKVDPVVIKMDLTYHHSAGAHFSFFFTRLKEREIYGIDCPQCKSVFLPPRPYCGGCCVRTQNWVKVGPAGTVRAISEIFLPILDAGTGKKRKVPHTMVLVQLDGTESLLHHVVVDDDDQPPVEMCGRVEVVFAQETTGTMRDIIGFRPLPPAQDSESDQREKIEVNYASVSIKTFKERIQIPFAYSPGSVGQEFFTGLKAGKLRGLCCRDCHYINLPPVNFCQRCFSDSLDWQDVPHVGMVAGVACSDAGEFDHLPADVYGFALVRLDGMESSFLHHLLDREIIKGDRVEVVFNAERRGHILDIRGFTKLTC